MTNYLLLDDGYTHEACVAEAPGVHAELVFTYRPLIREERALVAEATRQQTNSTSATKLLAETIAAHLTTWTLPHDISADAIGQLVPDLFDKLYAILAGTRPSDPLPGSGLVPIAYDEGADLKN